MYIAVSLRAISELRLDSSGCIQIYLLKTSMTVSMYWYLTPRERTAFLRMSIRSIWCRICTLPARIGVRTALFPNRAFTFWYVVDFSNTRANCASLMPWSLPPLDMTDFLYPRSFGSLHALVDVKQIRLLHHTFSVNAEETIVH